MSYLKQLQQDWDTLGFSFDIPLPPPLEKVEPKEVKSYSDLHYLMIGTTLNIASIYSQWNRNRITADESQLQTDLGKRLLFLCNLPRYNRSVDRNMCGQAEPLIAASLDPKNIQSDTFPSPVIVTRNDQTVGVVKRDGVRGYYALRDDPQTNTYERFIYRTEFENWDMPFLHKKQSRNAGNITLDEIKDKLLGGRLTFFATPVEARGNISVPVYRQANRPSLQTSHETLVAFADQALEYSTHTEVGYKYTKENN